MSVDIDWSLLSIPSSLSDGLVSVLNEQLNTASRPSFLGPITVTSLDFGSIAPNVEIKDVRDVWRAFDDGDDEGDAADEAESPEEYPFEYEYEYDHHYRHYNTSPTPLHHGARTTGASTPARIGFSPQIDDDESVYSGSRSVASVGIGLGFRRLSTHPYPSRRASETPKEEEEGEGKNIPPVQMHLRLEHSADMSMTLTTSLQVNYPSALFMSLPLKLVVTGLTIAADIVVAYSARKHRVHFTIVDDEPGAGARILPQLHIESEIGHADAHVLRNVGKVERFIVEVLRRTIVEELVFPNFHTIAL